MMLLLYEDYSFHQVVLQTHPKKILLKSVLKAGVLLVIFPLEIKQQPDIAVISRTAVFSTNIMINNTTRLIQMRV